MVEAVGVEPTSELPGLRASTRVSFRLSLAREALLKAPALHARLISFFLGAEKITNQHRVVIMATYPALNDRSAGSRLLKIN